MFIPGMLPLLETHLEKSLQNDPQSFLTLQQQRQCPQASELLRPDLGIQSTRLADYLSPGHGRDEFTQLILDFCRQKLSLLNGNSVERKGNHWKKEQGPQNYNVFFCPSNYSSKIDFLCYSDPASLACSCHCSPQWTQSTLQAFVGARGRQEGHPASCQKGFPAGRRKRER